MANAKEVIELKSYYKTSGITFEVMKLTNRIEPSIGSFLSTKEVEALIIEAKRPYTNLSVKIS